MQIIQLICLKSFGIGIQIMNPKSSCFLGNGIIIATFGMRISRNEKLVNYGTGWQFIATGSIILIIWYQYLSIHQSLWQTENSFGNFWFVSGGFRIDWPLDGIMSTNRRSIDNHDLKFSQWLYIMHFLNIYLVIHQKKISSIMQNFLPNIIGFTSLDLCWFFHRIREFKWHSLCYRIATSF